MLGLGGRKPGERRVTGRPTPPGVGSRPMRLCADKGQEVSPIYRGMSLPWIHRGRGCGQRATVESRIERRRRGQTFESGFCPSAQRQQAARFAFMVFWAAFALLPA